MDALEILLQNDIAFLDLSDYGMLLILVLTQLTHMLIHYLYFLIEVVKLVQLQPHPQFFYLIVELFVLVTGLLEFLELPRLSLQVRTLEL